MHDIFFKLMADPNADQALLRVWRWLLQWPESVAFTTMLDVNEVNLGLRWKILERDGRRCRACGHGIEDGAKLVIDHIKPFSKGGLTTEDNLQVVCQECNAGKFNRWLELA